MTTTGPHTNQQCIERERAERSGRRSFGRWAIPLVVVGGLALAACDGGEGDGGASLGGSLPDVTIGSGAGVIGDGSDGADVTLPSTEAAGEGVEVGDGDGQPAAEDVASQPEPLPADPAVGVVVTTDDGLTSEEWAAVVVVAIVVIAVIAGLVAVLSGRSRDRHQEQSASQHRRDQIVGGCRWAHDQAALTVLGTSDPAMLRSTWSTVERQLLELESNIAVARAHTDGGTVADLAAAGSAVSALRGALAADVAARSGSATPAPEIVAQTRQNVLARNGELDAATARLGATRV